MSQTYFSPDFYYATQATTGQSPSVTPARWQALAIPADLKASIVLMAASQLHQNAEQGAALFGQASAMLSQAVQEAMRRDGRAVQLKVINRP